MRGIKTWFFNIFGGRRGPKVDEIWALTKQFHVTLQSQITKVEQTAPEPPPKTLERIRNITVVENKRLTWQDAYDIEQQLVHLYDEETLNVELSRRLLEAGCIAASQRLSVVQKLRGKCHSSR